MIKYVNQEQEYIIFFSLTGVFISNSVKKQI